MDIQAEKYKLMEWLINLKDESVISKIKSLKKSVSKSNWSSDISKTEQLLIKAGLKDIDEGNTFTHEQIQKEINKKYGI